MYKDKDKQREVNRERQRRYRRDKKDVTNQGVTVTPDERKQIEKDMVGIGLKPVSELPERTALPGDADYVPQCETTRAFIEGRAKRPETGKRGKDIKCFADLPDDVQITINSLSKDKADKTKRTAAAIRYQHLFPDRYDNRGMPAELAAVTGKPGDADYDGVCTDE